MTTSLTSDWVHDFPCTSCEEEDINREANVWCVTCDQYLCDPCLKVHNRMAGGKQHQFVDKKAFKQTLRTGNPDIPTDVCTKHRGKLVDMFCEAHDEIGCGACMSLDHRSCKKVSYIPDVAKSRVTDHDIQTAEQNLSQQLRSVETLRDDRQKHKSRMSNEKDEALNAVTERRKAIDSYLDKQERTIRQRISDIYEEHTKNLDVDIKGCDDMIQKLKWMESKLQGNLKRKSASQTFVDIKDTKSKILTVERKRNAFNENRNEGRKFGFRVGKAVSDILVPESIFGSVEAGVKPATRLSHTENVNIRHKTDKLSCSCIDICQLPNDTIILTDWTNSNIKSLRHDTEYTLTDTLPMSGQPWGVCVVGQSEVAVTMPRDQTVSFVSTDNKLTVKRSFKVTGHCWGIIQVNRHLYIGDNQGGNIKVYGLKGKCLNTISKDKDGSSLFESPFHLCLWSDKQQIAVADSEKGVVVIDMSGNPVSRYTYPNHKFIFGSCLHDNGNVFIVDSHSKDIISVDPHGDTTVLTTTKKKPTHIYFHRKTGKVFIGLKNCDYIQVFSLVY